MGSTDGSLIRVPDSAANRTAAREVAGVLLGSGWTCAGCGATCMGTAPEDGRCKACAGDDGAAAVPVPA